MLGLSHDDEVLGSFERRSLGFFRFINEHKVPKAVQRLFHRVLGKFWVQLGTYNLLQVHGLEHLRDLPGDRGILLCANHRSFFDQFVITHPLIHQRLPWAKNFYYPVRSNFFYETVPGVLLNLFFGGGSMYPPIFRDHSKSGVNKDSMNRLGDLLRTPGNVVGVHPEGMRGKGPDPYQLLKAQPGAGQLALRARATIVPVFINGLSNDFARQFAANFRGGDKRGEPIIIVFGPPVDLGELANGTPRAAQYKRVSDRILEDIRKLGEQERLLRNGSAISG